MPHQPHLSHIPTMHYSILCNLHHPHKGLISCESIIMLDASKYVAHLFSCHNNAPISQSYNNELIIHTLIRHSSLPLSSSTVDNTHWKNTTAFVAQLRCCAAPLTPLQFNSFNSPFIIDISDIHMHTPVSALSSPTLVQLCIRALASISAWLNTWTFPIPFTSNTCSHPVIPMHLILIFWQKLKV